MGDQTDRSKTLESKLRALKGGGTGFTVAIRERLLEWFRENVYLSDLAEMIESALRYLCYYGSRKCEGGHALGIVIDDLCEEFDIAGALNGWVEELLPDMSGFEREACKDEIESIRMNALAIVRETPISSILLPLADDLSWLGPPRPSRLLQRLQLGMNLQPGNRSFQENVCRGDGSENKWDTAALYWPRTAF